MRAYKEYKDSGYDWLGKIPAHWEWLYLFQICREQYQKNNTKEELPVLSLSYGKIIIKENIDFGLTPNDYLTYQIVKNGNIILRLTDLQNDHKSLRTGLVKNRGIITSAYTCITTSCNYNFIHYLLHAYDCHKIFYGLGGGVRQSIGYAQIKNIKLPIPPREEQDAIVRFLDAKCAKIDSLIKLKERQIALLNEKKQNIINQAVTRGLDPNAPMKDSGVDWIGEIPEGWEMKKVRRCFSSTLGKMLASEAKSPNDTFEKYFCAKDVHFSGIDSSDLKKMWFSEKEKIQFAVEKGDLLVVEGGAGAGGAAIFNEEGSYYIQNSIHRIRAKNGHDNNFLYYWLFALVNRKYIDFACNKATIPHFTGDKLKEMPFPVMPLEEERQICHYLNEKLQLFETIIRNIKREIDLLVEYRARFISDVVTGKINIL